MSKDSKEKFRIEPRKLYKMYKRKMYKRKLYRCEKGGCKRLFKNSTKRRAPFFVGIKIV